VKRNKGAGGVDGMGVDELLQYLKDNGEEIRESILVGKYRPAPVRRVEIPKDNGKRFSENAKPIWKKAMCGRWIWILQKLERIPDASA